MHDAHHRHAHDDNAGPDPHAYPHGHEAVTHAHPHAPDAITATATSDLGTRTPEIIAPDPLRMGRERR